jgi:hypothetical protein
MCYAGGPRCDGEGRRRLAKAQAAYDHQPTGDNFKKLLDAKSDYDLTLAGINELRELAVKERDKGNESEAIAFETRAEVLQSKRDALKAAREAAGLADNPTDHSAETEADQSSDDTARTDVFTKKYEDKREQIKAFQAELDNYIENLGDGRNYLTLLETMSHFSHYSPTNQMLIAIQSEGKAREIKTFKAWEKEGVKVLKGSKALRIFAPVKWSKETDQEDENGEKVVKQGVSFTALPMFDISQTDRRQIESITHLPTTPPSGYIEDLHTAIQDSGYTVRYVDDIDFGTHGYTDPAKKEVVISRRWDEAGQAKTLAHELAHIKAGHTDHIDDYRTHRGRMEVEAESIAYVISRANGMGTEISDYSASYVKGWAGTDAEVIKASAFKVSTVAKDLLDNFKFRNLTPSTEGSPT